MEMSNAIALGALVVSLLALPISYFVATRQVRVGLDEHERRLEQRTRMITADRLDELVSLFFGAAKALANVDVRQAGFDVAALERNIAVIDDAVVKTGILDRLGKAIDNYLESGDSTLQAQNGIATRLQMIRGQTHRGSTASGPFATWEILNICRNNELASLLRP